MLLDAVKDFLMVELVGDEDPNDDGVTVFEEQYEVGVHDVEREVERPHRVEDRMSNVEDDCVHSGVEENRPEVVTNASNVDQEVD